MCLAFGLTRAFPFVMLICLAGKQHEVNDPTEGKGKNKMSLKTEEQRVVDYLQRDWQKRFRATTIPEGMAAVGIAFDHQTRLRIGRFLQAKGISAKRMSQADIWLTNNEKLLARFLAQHYEATGKMLTLDECQQKLKLTSREVQDGFSVLKELGFLELKADGTWQLSPRAREILTGGLRLNFHTLHVDDSPAFSVN